MGVARSHLCQTLGIHLPGKKDLDVDGRLVAIVGAGLIGSSMARLFTEQGLDVTVHDPDDAARHRLEAASRTWHGPRHTLRVDAQLGAALQGAQFVFEAAPERLPVKRELLAKIEPHIGADIVIASRKLDQCEEAAHMVESLGRRALPISCHVGKWEALQELADAAYAHFGKVDILANNAGLSPVVGASASVTEDLFDKIIDVNFKAPFRLTTIIAPRMMDGEGGSVINVSSTGAIRPKPVFTVYSGAKAAVNSTT